MSTHQARLESRVRVLERRQTDVEANVEELYTDREGDYAKITEYLVKLEEHISTLEESIVVMEARNDGKLAAMEARILKTVRDDMESMEGRILDAFKQLITVVSPQQPPQ